jgi:hypothetical protein
MTNHLLKIALFFNCSVAYPNLRMQPLKLELQPQTRVGKMVIPISVYKQDTQIGKVVIHAGKIREKRN